MSRDMLTGDEITAIAFIQVSIAILLVVAPMLYGPGGPGGPGR